MIKTGEREMGISLAVIGVGRWGKNHVRVLTQLRKTLVDKVVIVDINPNRLKYIVKKYQPDSYYTSIEDLVKREKNLDGAIVAVPTVYHYKVASILIDHYHLLIEKPLAATIEEGYNLVRRAQENDKAIAVGHIERFNPIVNIAYNIIKKQDEKPTGIVGERLGPGPPGRSTLNLGVAHDLLVHDIDISNHFLNEKPVSVIARIVKSPDFPYETEIIAIYEYPGDTFSMLKASWRTAPFYKRRYLKVQMETTSLSINYILRTINIEKGLKKVKIRNSSIDSLMHFEENGIEISYVQKEPLVLELNDFIESIKSGKKPQVDAILGYVALKCVEEARRAAFSGRKVNIRWEEIDKILS